MIYQTRAIVLRTVKYGETSLIVDMYTEQKGHQTFIINGVRKQKASTPASSLQLLSLVDMVGYHHEGRAIHRIKEVRLEYPWRSIPFDMRKTAVITCLAEICAKCINTAYPNQELFNYLHEILIDYDLPETYDRDFLIRALVGLSHFLGFGFEIPDHTPSGHYFDLMEGGIVSVLPVHPYIMEMSDLEALRIMVGNVETKKREIRIEVRRRLVDVLVLYYQLHVETLKEVHSLKILRELLY